MEHIFNVHLHAHADVEAASAEDAMEKVQSGKVALHVDYLRVPEVGVSRIAYIDQLRIED